MKHFIMKYWMAIVPSVIGYLMLRYQMEHLEIYGMTLPDAHSVFVFGIASLFVFPFGAHFLGEDAEKVLRRNYAWWYQGYHGVPFVIVMGIFVFSLIIPNSMSFIGVALFVASIMLPLIDWQISRIKILKTQKLKMI